MPLSKISTFVGGVNIPDMKALTENKRTEVMPEPERVYISLSQHIGKPAIAKVGVGDVVKKYQLVAEQDGAISANVYTGVSGVVEDVKRITTHAGWQTFIIIKNDFSGGEKRLPAIDKDDPQAILSRIKEAGIVGLGGAGFSTFVKLTPKDKVDILLVNAAECEPYLTCDHRVLLENTREFVIGARLISKALGGAKIVVGVEDNKPDAIGVLASFSDITVVPLKKKYPQGSEKQMIFAATGRKVGIGKLPASSGVCVQNVQTVKSVYDAVIENIPLTERVMTVSGHAVKEPKNVRVTIGTPYTEIVNFCGGDVGSRMIVVGGPMMGKVLPRLYGFLRKTDSGLLLLNKDEINKTPPSPCINCGRCAAACPMRLMPMYIDLYTHEGKFDRAAEYGVMNCFECGACAYVCPSKRDLVGSMQYCKKKLRETNG